MTVSNNLIETERTYLRQLTLDDVDNVLQIFSDLEAMKYSPAATTQDRTDAEDFIKWSIQNYEKHGLGAWAVIAKSTGKYIGQSGLIPQEIGLEVFYSFIREFWGQGFATEVASACKDYAFQKLQEARLISIIHPDNNRAIKVAQKLAMQNMGMIEFWNRTNLLFEICNNYK